MKVSPAWRPLAPGSHPRKWSNERFSIMRSTSCSIPEASGSGGGEAVSGGSIATARARSTQASASPPAAAAAADRNARRGSGHGDWRRGVDAGMITSNRWCRPERGNGANLNHIVASRKAARGPTGVTFGQRANGGDGSGAVTMTSGISLRAPGAILLISCYELGHQPLGAAWPRAFLERAGYAPDTLDLAVEPLDEAKGRRGRLGASAARDHCVPA